MLENVNLLSLKEVEEQVKKEIKDTLGRAWDALSDREQGLLDEIIKDAIKIYAKKFAGKDVHEEINIINVTLRNLSVAKFYDVKKVFWMAAARVGVLAIETITKAAIAVV